MEKTIIKCDLCGHPVDESTSHAWIARKGYQKWGNNDVCRPCCVILDEAQRRRMIIINEDDIEQIMRRAGYKKDGDIWICQSKNPYMSLFLGDDVVMGGGNDTN